MVNDLYRGLEVHTGEKPQMLNDTKTVAKVSSISITKLQAVQSMRPNDASSRCTAQKMHTQKFL